MTLPVLHVDCTGRNADYAARSVDLHCAVRCVGRHMTVTGGTGPSTPTRAPATGWSNPFIVMFAPLIAIAVPSTAPRRTAHRHLRADDPTDPHRRLPQTNR